MNSLKLIKDFVAAKIGYIKAGNLHYELDTVTGLIDYTVMLKVGSFIFSKTFNFNGNYQADLKLLTSANIHVGLEFQIDKLQFKVIEVDENFHTAILKLHFEGEDVDGRMEVDISGKLLTPVQLHAQGTVKGFAIELLLTEA